MDPGWDATEDGVVMLDVDDGGLSPSDPVSPILPDGGGGESSQTSVPHGAVLRMICAHRPSRGTGGLSMASQTGSSPRSQFCWMRVEDEGTG